ncbi:hypothetical protein NPIL_13611 [Nephila pilipes]|uniref:Uncharacterized protein n=1 Tax=Nephila pilipes TaxID=299642 RepID=A0A8X6QT38_NEPPI|nr:hypothetical protein NPIL_13611 [Nephila pilipes]
MATVGVVAATFFVTCLLIRHLPYALSRVLCCAITIVLCSHKFPSVLCTAIVHSQYWFWCALSDFHNIAWPFHYIVTEYRFVKNQINLFVNPLTEDERLYGYFQQDGATAHTVLTILSQVLEVFDVRRTVSKVRYVSWPPRSPDKSLCDSHPWNNCRFRCAQIIFTH